MYLVKTPEAIRPFANQLVWSIDTDRDVLYLTFDDGPGENTTPWVLNLLDQYQAKATFFCIGGNVAKHPGLYREILSRGHRTGNHTWNHMDGWKFSDYSYLRNVLECSEVVRSDLFRPPYGKIKRSQAMSLRKRFKIIMWEVLSADWDEKISPQKCFQNVVRHSRKGSIVVFHDSEKAFNNLQFALPRTLEHFSAMGFKFEALPA